MTDQTKKTAFLLRIPDDLRRELAAWAADEQRTVTGLIVWLLGQLVTARKGGGL